MSVDFVNRICPYCKDPNYMIDISDVSKTYKYKCMNCYNYFNDNDFEPLQPTLKTKCMNKKVDIVEVVRCKDCKYCNNKDYVCEHPNEWGNEDTRNQRNPEWFCADGERKEG